MNFKKRFVFSSLMGLALSVSAFSLGFSSFLVGGSGENTANQDLSFSVADVIIASDYASLNKEKGDDNTGIDIFEYNSVGFVENETVLYEPTMTFYIKFNTTLFFNSLDKNTAEFIYILKYSDLDTSHFSMLTSTYFDINNSSVSYIEGQNGNYDGTLTGLQANFSINDENKEITLSFTYSFDESKFIDHNYSWFEIKFAFNVGKDKYSNIYTNELNTDNRAHYLINVEIK